MRRLAVLTLLVAVGAAACGGGGSPEPAAEPAVPPTEESTQPAADPADETAAQFPDVIAAEARRSDDNTLVFDVTVSSAYDTPERYADAWRVIGPDGTVYAQRELLHDHAGEQPFTRSLDGVEIPVGVTTVTIEGRDLVNGWGGGTVDVELPPPIEPA